ncbi:MAG: ankyrin repeat domain-containing protein [Candidatus Cardinium sp.]
MNKKYIYPKLGLWIGLLYFYSLSPCVNARQAFETAALSSISVVPDVSTQLTKFNTSPTLPAKLRSNITSANVEERFIEERSIIKGTQQKPEVIKRIQKRFAWSKKPSGEVKHPMVLDDEILQSMDQTVLNDLSGKDRLSNRVTYCLEGNKINWRLSKEHWLKCIKYWHGKGLNVNAKNKDGDTLLMKAVITEDEDTIRFLLGQGADVNVQNNAEETALFCATRKVLDKMLLEIWGLKMISLIF